MRHIYLIEDGEYHWISAESPERAIEIMAQDYSNSGKPQERTMQEKVDEYKRDMEPSVKQVPDNDGLTVKDAGPDETPLTRDAGEWAADAEGLVATTAGY